MSGVETGVSITTVTRISSGHGSQNSSFDLARAVFNFLTSTDPQWTLPILLSSLLLSLCVSFSYSPFPLFLSLVCTQPESSIHIRLSVHLWDFETSLRIFLCTYITFQLQNISWMPGSPIPSVSSTAPQVILPAYRDASEHRPRKCHGNRADQLVQTRGSCANSHQKATPSRFPLLIPFALWVIAT